MRSLVIAFAFSILAPAPALAQPATRPAAMAQPDIAAQRTAIGRVGWLVGQWEGSGWIDMPGGRETFRQTETIENRLGGALLLIEGKGYAGAPETMMFNAFGVLSYDDRSGKYALRSHTRGYSTDAQAEVKPDGSLIWSMTPPGQIIRYTISQPRPGAWLEIGERSTDAGATWRQFFEMSLTRKP